jgi:hypothetical protein
MATATENLISWLKDAHAREHVRDQYPRKAKHAPSTLSAYGSEGERTLGGDALAGRAGGVLP